MIEVEYESKWTNEKIPSELIRITPRFPPPDLVDRILTANPQDIPSKSLEARKQLIRHNRLSRGFCEISGLPARTK